MKTQTLPRVLAISSLLFALSAQAHDPKEHMQNTEQADCTAMNDMDQSKMDMNDPVVMAMMQQCMNTMQQASPAEGESHAHGHAEHMTGAGKVGDHMLAPSQQ